MKRLFILINLCSLLTMLNGFGQDVHSDMDSIVIDCIHSPQSIAVLPFLISNHFTSKAENKLKPGDREKLERSLGEFVQLEMSRQLSKPGEKTNTPFCVLDKFWCDKILFDSCQHSPYEMELAPVEFGRILNADAVITGTFIIHEQTNDVHLLPEIIGSILFNWWIDLSPGKDDPTVVGKMHVTMTCVKDGAVLWDLTTYADTRFRHKQLIRNAVRKSLKEFPKK